MGSLHEQGVWRAAGHLLTAIPLHLEVIQELSTGATHSSQIVSTTGPDNSLSHFILRCVALVELNNNFYTKKTGGTVTCIMERGFFLHK